MSKYAPLISYLSSNDLDILRLKFDEIEEILGDALPPSARAHLAWWSNSSTDATHSWARDWVKAGWRAYPKLLEAAVEFRRAKKTTAAELKPATHSYIMDLVREAGIDVSEWKFNSNGEHVKAPRANPRFCYNWSFGNPTDGFVLCVWHEFLTDEKGEVVYRSDTGTLLRTFRERLSGASTTQEQRSRLIPQIRRAEAFIEAVNQAFLSQQPIRLIINLGQIRREESVGDESSTVELRELDREEWFVFSMNEGNALIVRGRRPDSLGAANSEYDEPPDDLGLDDVWREGQVRRRHGQPKFRAALLEAYQRRCAVTGCVLEPLLEAAHIVPHSEATDYRTGNGILLRSDIHTLYDLHHLSIDGRGRIYLSSAARNSEYRAYEGRHVNLPALRSAPSPTSLDARHVRFLAREAERL